MNSTTYFSIYGSIATPLIMMIWLYFCIYIFLIGAFINRFFHPAVKLLYDDHHQKRVREKVKKKSTNNDHIERLSFILGAILFGISIYLCLAFVSYFTTGAADQTLIEEPRDGEVMNEQHEFANTCGSLGAYAAWFFIKRSFGLPAFLIPILLFMTAIHLMKAYRVNLLKWTLSSMLLMEWASVALATFLQPLFDDASYSPGGDHGVFVSQYIGNLVGSPGHERLNRAPDAKALTRWVKMVPKPIAVFCPNDLRAWQLLNVCRECGVDVPHEVSILGLDNDVLVCGFSKPMISSIDPGTMEIGRMAMQTLVEMIEDPRLSKRQIIRQVDPVGVVERASTEVYPVEPPWLSDALVFIRKHVSDRLTASEVYANLNRSHTTVDAAFRKVLGTTVQKMIASVRIEAARHLLLTSDLPIVRIAERCGFASQEYFSRAFSAAERISPAAWRLKKRESDSSG